MEVICEAHCEKKGLFFKNLFDLFLQLTPLSDKNPSFRQVCFKASPFGFEIYTSCENFVFIIARISSDFFSQFPSKGKTISFGMSLDHLKNIFKNAKRNDNIIFKIHGVNDEAISMNIDIIKEHLSHDVLFVNEIKVTLVQNELLDYSDRISNGMEIHQQEYLTICRSILTQSAFINISRKDNNLKFSFNQNELSSSNITIGKPFVDDHTMKFNAHCFKNTHKLTNFGTPIKIYVNQYQPIVLESMTNVFNIRIWMKSNEQLTLE